MKYFHKPKSIARLLWINIFKEGERYTYYYMNSLCVLLCGRICHAENLKEFNISTENFPQMRDEERTMLTVIRIRTAKMGTHPMQSSNRHSSQLTHAFGMLDSTKIVVHFARKEKNYSQIHIHCAFWVLSQQKLISLLMNLLLLFVTAFVSFSTLFEVVHYNSMGTEQTNQLLFCISRKECGSTVICK